MLSLRKCLLLHIYLSIWIHFSLCSDVISTTGNIGFDTNLDSNLEANLNTNGLGVGTNSPSANLHIVGNALIQNGSLMIGTSSANSTLQLQGSIGFGLESISSNVLASSNSIILADSSSGNIGIELPAAQTMNGRVYWIKKMTNENTVWISSSGNYIDQFEKNILTLTTSSIGYPSVGFISDGSKWWITHQLSSGNLNQTIASDNLVSWYKLDDTDPSGNAFDSGTLGIQVPYTNASGNLAIDAVLNKGLRVNNGGTYAEVTGQNYQLDNTDFTICYFGIEDSGAATAGGRYGFWFQSSASDEIYNGLGDDTQLRFYVSGAGVFAFASPAGFDRYSWNHYACVFKKNIGGYIYLNGTLVASDESGVGSLSGNTISRLNIGRRPGNAWRGTMDDLRVYNKALSSEEIQQLANLRPE